MPSNQGLTIFQRDHLAQKIGLIVLYKHAKNHEEPESRFGEKAKNVKKKLF